MVDLGVLVETAERLSKDGKTALFAAIDGRAVAVIAVEDPIKASTPAAIVALHALGLETAMITGDSRAAAEAIARRLGIDHVTAEVLPRGKVKAVEALKEVHGATAFVGDGINDAPALAAADIGLAIGTGTDVAIGAADVVLVSGELTGVATAIHLSRKTMRNIRQNLGWAFGYNVVLIPISAGVLYPATGLFAVADARSFRDGDVVGLRFEQCAPVEIRLYSAEKRGARGRIFTGIPYAEVVGLAAFWRRLLWPRDTSSGLSWGRISFPESHV